eukprot:TRINITY_DN2980_c0_g1_i1.p1 TRINITY_DN2980_c0_g1~~TRINITY_DN2980_c0_g1_i1.p1  ORF type:complete len:340 (-),score=37.37 TRINITY_DN2980_c0_g1_i1:140-1084(-)
MAAAANVHYQAFLDTHECDAEVRPSLSIRRAVASVCSVAAVGVILWAGMELESPGLVLVPAPRSTLLKRDSALRGQSASSAANTSLANVVPIELAELSSVNCWKDTGGTCNIQQCLGWRRATCDRSGLIHHCNCPDGCVGADFSCHDGRNEMISSGFQLTNGRWPTSYLYEPVSSFFNQLRVGGPGLGDNHFALHEVPGMHNGRKKYMMSSVKFPDHLLAMKPTGKLIGSAWKGVDVKSANPIFLLWTVCRPRNYDGPNLQFGIGNDEYKYAWIYVHSFSYLVYGWVESLWGSPDDRAQWTPSVHLDATFDECP